MACFDDDRTIIEYVHVTTIYVSKLDLEHLTSFCKIFIQLAFLSLFWPYTIHTYIYVAELKSTRKDGTTGNDATKGVSKSIIITSPSPLSVSYTHLTLPTIYSV